MPTPPAAHSGTAVGYHRQPPKLAIVMHEKMLPADLPTDDSDSEDSYAGQLRAMIQSSLSRDKPVRFGLPQVIVMDPSWHKGGYDADKQLRKVGDSSSTTGQQGYWLMLLPVMGAGGWFQ